MSSSKKRQLATGNKNKKGAVSSSSLVKISGQRRSRDYEVDPVLAAQRSQKWHDMPYAALQLIALYHCETAYDAIVLGLVYSRFDDTVANYLPADVWSRFYDHFVNVQYHIPQAQLRAAALPIPDTHFQFPRALNAYAMFLVRNMSNPILMSCVTIEERGKKTAELYNKLSAAQKEALTSFQLQRRRAQDDDDDCDEEEEEEEEEREEGLPIPDTLQAYSNATRRWQLYIDDARALRETFRGVKNLSDCWNVQALGTVAEWEGVKVENGRVTEVDLSYTSLQGSVDLTKLPAKLQNLWLSGNQLSGSVDLTQLPTKLQHLDLNGNQFSGSVRFTQLPASLQELCLQSNQFSGVIDLTQLPENMRHLVLSDNDFEGSTRVNNKKCKVKVDSTVEIKE